MIWFDIDNTPHVPVFRFIFKELDKKSVEYIITARDFAQTEELLNLYGIHYLLLGEHGGKNKIKKIFNLINRAQKLNKSLKDKNIELAISHGSRSQLIVSKLSRIPSIVMLDYEFTEHFIFNSFADFILIPKFIPDERLKENGFNLRKIIRYNGFKEEIYIKYFEPNNNFRKELGVNENEILIVLRPPSIVSNYHNKKSEELLIATVKHLEKFSNVKILIVNRTNEEKKLLFEHIADKEKFIMLRKPVDGLQLLYCADMVISGGGTMNREAALLGTPTYSIFGGKRPYLDLYLEKIGRLNYINNVKDVEKIEPKRLDKKDILLHSDNLSEELTEVILELKSKRIKI